MAPTRERSPARDGTDPKRIKTTHVTPSHTPSPPAPLDPLINTNTDLTSQFACDVFNHNYIANLHADYLASAPFKHSVVEKLFQDELLGKVKDECLRLSFTQKETDIYKIKQTGDLVSLNYLSNSQISQLTHLRTLRDALYSPQFRQFLRAVTGCGPLSGQKQDMAVNTYTQGCHLLNHDDAIDTRRVSYILYMPLPHDQPWQKNWGGSLELYPVKRNQEGQLEPEAIPSKSISPSWNQFVFFEVQPGRSFHSVEEVVVEEQFKGRTERLSISGWFHAPQQGEEGYIPDALAPEMKSSREQLTSTSTVFKPYLQSPTFDPDLGKLGLSEDHIPFLAEFINPVYLQARTMQALASRFIQESSLELHSFLNNSLAAALEYRLRDLDTREGLGQNRAGTIPLHTTGTSSGWVIKGPPHKWRYCTLKPQEDGVKVAVSPRAHAPSADEIMRSLQDELFPSPAFRAWLAIISRLLPLRYAVEARRFRPGLDYTLATSEDKEARLDVVLGLMPPEKGSEKSTDSNGAESQLAQVGGWDCYMAPHDGEDDPAVYRSGSTKKKGKEPQITKNIPPSPPSTSKPKKSNEDPDSSDSMVVINDEQDDINEGPADSPLDPGIDAAGGVSMQDDEDEDDESTLLATQPGFNKLLLVLRDERVMRFVKYVSAAAPGSRWDICGEYEVGIVEEEDGDDSESG